MQKSHKKNMIIAAAASLILTTGLQTAHAGPNCIAQLTVEKGGSKSSIEYFTARGSSNSAARAQARRCVEAHWAFRWDGTKPQDCKTAKKVDNYGITKIKKWIENRACEKGWKTGNVKLVLRTEGGSHCASKVELGPYMMRSRFCN